LFFLLVFFAVQFCFVASKCAGTFQPVRSYARFRCCYCYLLKLGAIFSMGCEFQ